MADRTFTVDIVTPERVVLHDRATSVVAPGVKGSFGILVNHAPFLSQLAVGELRYRKENGQEVRFAIGGGFLQVFDNQVTVLADTAERAEEINLDRARKALEVHRQERAALGGKYYSEETELVETAIERSQNRIRVAGA